MGTRRVVPQPRQSRFISCPANEILYGGARGGGKSFAVLLDWLAHEARWGGKAKGILFRRTLPELEDMQAKAEALFPACGGLYKEQVKTWVFPSGAKLKLRYLERDKDADRYQGHEYNWACVAVGTMVVMADGSTKPIQDIRRGEMVMTLDGPRMVTGTVKPYKAKCVRAYVLASGRVLASQVHPVWHPVLSIDGLFYEHTTHSHRNALRSQNETFDQLESCEQSRPCEGQEPQGWFSYSKGDRNGYTEFEHDTPGNPQPLVKFCRAVLHAPTIHSKISRLDIDDFSIQYDISCKSSEPLLGLNQRSTLESLDRLPLLVRDPQSLGHSLRYCSSVLSNAHGENCKVPGSRVDCPISDGSCDEHAHFLSGIYPINTPSLGDVGQQSHDSLKGELGTIPTHSRDGRLCVEHPYGASAIRPSQEVVSADLILVPCGDSMVCDISVEGCNHYITDTGLVNRNCFEEAGNWPSPKPLDKIKACLRSADRVALRLVLTANPGGVGHNWLKARFIDPTPAGKLQRLEGGWTRVYIPAKVTDNPALLKSDPGYIERIKEAAGSPEMVKAWLDGSWDIVAGGMFDDVWGQNTLQPFDIPASWTITRSFDWGSARPFSVGFWAESDGTEATLPDGTRKAWPRGSLFRIGEIYGWNGKPNEGCRKLAVEVARDILAFQQAVPWGGRVRPGPADNSIWDAENGVCIGDDMAKLGVRWERSDKSPGSRRTGWEAMRRMFKAAKKTPMEEPGLFVFDTCRHFIRTVPTLPRDSKTPDDIDSDAEDHIADETRYRVLAIRRTATVRPLML